MTTKDKIKAVLHRRKKSTPSQSPRASYEAEERSPHAERHPTSPTQRGHNASEPVHNDAHRIAQTQPSSLSNVDSSDIDANGSIADNYRSYLPALASESPTQQAVGTSSHKSTVRTVPPEVSTETHVVGRNKLTNGQNGASYIAGHMDGEQAPSLAVTTDHQHVHGNEDWREKQQSLLEGVVDLNNTVDTDRDTKWAPAVQHEVIKPHEHEVIQHQVHREIHNYTYYHRLQPVLQTEVLPPRHFIPNPNGEGLIEISADELPNRTGKNRWWDIVQKETELPDAAFQWRTEPEVIQGKPYVTQEGFERRETTIIYPPTLEDMSDYRGMVQPVHFDHKTGERWLGEMTTVDKLQEEVEQMKDQNFLAMREVTANLPEVPSSPAVQRKPIGRDSL